MRRNSVCVGSVRHAGRRHRGRRRAHDVGADRLQRRRCLQGARMRMDICVHGHMREEMCMGMCTDLRTGIRKDGYGACVQTLRAWTCAQERVWARVRALVPVGTDGAKITKPPIFLGLTRGTPLSPMITRCEGLAPIPTSQHKQPHLTRGLINCCGHAPPTPLAGPRTHTQQTPAATILSPFGP